jgi:ABC-type sugar transport system permease subunit
LHIYIQGFKFYKFGYAAALSYVLLTLVTILAAIQMRLMGRESMT